MSTKRYWRLIIIDEKGKPSYNNLYDMDLYDISMDSNWTTVWVRDDETCPTIKDMYKNAFVRSIPNNRVADVSNIELTEEEAMRRKK